MEIVNQKVSNKLIIINVIINFFLSIIFFLLMENKINIFSRKKIIKVAMCTFCKRENKYIKYFIEFYKNLGYNHFYFYDHNDKGDEKIDDNQIVKDGIKKGFISIIKFPYEMGNVGNFITQAYYNCYEKYSSQYDWISFFDVDEFLVFEPKNITIQEFLNNKRYNGCENIQFNWKIFSDNEKLEYEDKPLIERFTEVSNYEYEMRHVKPTIRGRLNYKKFIKSKSPHSIYNNIKGCSSSGKKTDCRYCIWPPDFEYASLNHYVTKTVREYFEKRYREKGDKMTENYKNQSFEYFFKVNKKTKEKVDMYNKLFHTNFQ